MSSQTNHSFSGFSVNSSDDIAYISAGRAFLAKAPNYKSEEIPSPSDVNAISWHNNEPWMSIPAIGAVVKTINIPKNVILPGAPRYLSKNFIFMSDNQVFDFDGKRIGSLPKVPTSILDIEKSTFVISNNTVFLIKDAVSRLRSVPNEHSLIENGNSFEIIPGNTVKLDNLIYRLKNSKLQLLSGESVIKSIDSDAKELAVGRNIIVTLGKKINVYQKSLNLIKSIDI